MLSENTQVAQKALDTSLKDLQNAKTEELSDFDDAWYSTLWRSYRAFGPSEEQPHGHGGFLSPLNGTYLSSGPLPPEAGLASPLPGGSGGRAATRKRAQAFISLSPPNTPSSAGGEDSTTNVSMEERMLSALEKSLGLGQAQVREKDIDKKIGYIKAMLSEFGNEMPEIEKSRLRRQLYALYSQAIVDTGENETGSAAADIGAGAGGAAAGP